MWFLAVIYWRLNDWCLKNLTRKPWFKTTDLWATLHKFREYKEIRDPKTGKLVPRSGQSLVVVFSKSGKLWTYTLGTLWGPEVTISRENNPFWPDYSINKPADPAEYEGLSVLRMGTVTERNPIYASNCTNG